MPHIFRNPSLCVPSMWQVHADLIPHIATLAELAKWSEHGGVDYDGLGATMSRASECAALFKQYANAPVFSAPVLSPEFCVQLLAEFEGTQFSVNEDEDAPFQIPELVLKHEALALHGSLAVHFDRLLLPMAGVLFNMVPSNLRSIQMAQYRPSDIGHGNWHLDLDSDFTAVVALSDTHEGGGTEVKPAGFREAFEVPSLPVGHAVLFPGKTHLHRGLEVTAGARNLLVFWSEIK